MLSTQLSNDGSQTIVRIIGSLHAKDENLQTPAKTRSFWTFCITTTTKKNIDNGNHAPARLIEIKPNDYILIV